MVAPFQGWSLSEFITQGCTPGFCISLHWSDSFPPRHPNPAPLPYPPILKLELTWNTALTIAKAMKPTKMKTAISTPLAITFVNMLS